MRHGAGEISARGIGALAQETDTRPRQRGERGGERANLRESGMALRERSQKNGATLALPERGRDAAVRLPHRRLANPDGHGLAGGAGGRPHHGRESAHEVGIGCVARDREEIVELARIQEGDLGALQGGLADAMRQQRHFAPQIRPDDEGAFEHLHVGDRQTEIRIDALLILAAEIDLAQTVIDVVGKGKICYKKIQI